METIKNEMSNLIDLALEQGYSKKAIEIIGVIVCSDTAVSLGYDPLESLRLAIECIKKYKNERDCINALIDIIK